jgi:hypothetical protein
MGPETKNDCAGEASSNLLDWTRVGYRARSVRLKPLMPKWSVVRSDSKEQDFRFRITPFLFTITPPSFPSARILLPSSRSPLARQPFCVSTWGDICSTRKRHVQGWEVLTRFASSLKITVFWYVTPFGVVDRYKYFSGTFCLFLQGRRVICRKDNGPFILYTRCQWSFLTKFYLLYELFRAMPIFLCI